MSTTEQPLKQTLLSLLAATVALVAIFGAAFAFSPEARADAIVFITRLGNNQATYPRSNAFLVGTTTPNATTKLGTYLNVGETLFRNAFDVASTTGNGTATTTGSLLGITRAGCITTIATSTATPVRLNFLAVATTSANGFVTWAYGACPNP